MPPQHEREREHAAQDVDEDLRRDVDRRMRGLDADEGGQHGYQRCSEQHTALRASSGDRHDLGSQRTQPDALAPHKSASRRDEGVDSPLRPSADLEASRRGSDEVSGDMSAPSDQPPSSTVTVGSVRFGNRLPLALIAGPCAMESRDHALETAEALKAIAAKAGIGLVYKSSFDKANRTSAASPRGLGLDRAMAIFAEVKERLGLPVTTDVHDAAQCPAVGEVVDILQIPAFLCRQTDLLVAAAETGRAVNVKKGQFLAPWDMRNVAAKVRAAGNSDVMVTERGASFGYNTLVSDMRSLPIMAETTGAPVIFDATHSVQQPGGQGTTSGGERRFVPVLARAAVAVGVAGVFIETHRDPDRAPSDGPNMVPLDEFAGLVDELMAFDALAKGRST